MKYEDYYLGLDVGTNSCGYATTDEQYNLLKYKGEPMWGSHVFEEGKQCADTRSFRSSRRRLNRKQQRIHLIQELFSKEIGNVDDRFFIRLQQSSLLREDAGEDKYTLFVDKDFDDIAYYAKYPTIHHLIKDLIDNKEKHDVRLVYLATAWLVSHRGHFLSEVNKDNVSEVLDFSKVYSDMVNCFEENEIDLPWADTDENQKYIRAILLEKVGIKTKTDSFKEKIYGGKFPKYEDEECSTEWLIKLLSGAVVEVSKLFPKIEVEEKITICFKKSEEDFLNAIANTEEYADLLIKLRAVYDWSLLYDAAGGSTCISDAKIHVFEQHKEDLKNLKSFIKKYLPKKYKIVFTEPGETNYVSYSYNFSGLSKKVINECRGKECKDKASQEEFCQYIKGLVKSIDVDEVDRGFYEDMLNRLDLGTFMPKQVMGDNRVIPYQLYYSELKQILENASAYLPFLSERDDMGYITKDKILSIMEYRIPYYVGPLHKDGSRFAWIVRKKEGRIYPWNFEEVVDLDASEQAFMDKLTNTCTYIPGEKVLPKNSLLYAKFMVLNEINNLRINGNRIDVELKQAIYEDLFKKYRTVSVSKIREYIKTNHLGKIGDKDFELTGVDITIKSSLKAYHDFRRLIESGVLTENDAEDIVTLITYVEDKKRVKKKIKESYPQLEEADLNYVSKLKYADFGRLSKLFLEGLKAADKNTGEQTSIIQALWNYNINLMELIHSDLFTFGEEMEECRKQYYEENPASIDSLLDDLYVSNAVRRPIYRTLAVVKDIVKATKCPPKKIFVEMARGGGEKGKRTKSRRVNIQEKYADYKKSYPNEVAMLSKLLEGKTDNELQDEKLYLYFMQLGKCMYSGENIDIEKLGSKLYDIEHIYPQSYVTDNSISNKILVKSELNGQKGNKYPINHALPGVQEKMKPIWFSYKERGLITEEKYKRLTRTTPFTEDEKMGFINRQLVETRQSTKAIATVLQKLYPDTEIVYVKAGLASDFRQNFDILKCRTINDLHHAKDAYLNVVCGDVYNTRFNKKRFTVNQEYSVNPKTIFTHEVHDGNRLVWNGENDIGRIRKTLLKNNIHYTRYAFIRKGGLFNQNPEKAKEGLIPLKKGLDTAKYGGYNNSMAACFLLVKYEDSSKKKTVTDAMFMPVEGMVVSKVFKDEEFAKNYCRETIASIEGRDVNDITVLGFPMGLKEIKINANIVIDGFRFCMAGKSNGGKIISLSSMMPINVGYEKEIYIKKLTKYIEKKKANKSVILDYEYDGISKETNIELYDLLVKKIECTIYAIALSNQVSILVKGREKFIDLSLEEQVQTILDIVNLFATGRTTGCNLKKLDGSGQAGVITMSSKISNIIKDRKNVLLENESSSGLFTSNFVDLRHLS